MGKKSEENITIQDMQAELRYAMPYHTTFVNGIIEDWNILISKMKEDKTFEQQYMKMHNDLKKTIEVLIFNNSGRSSIYESCDKYYRFSFDETITTLEKRLQRLDELNSSRKEFELCKSKPHNLREILAALDNY